MDFNIDNYKKMVPETMHQEHYDFNALFTCVKLKYIRNSYRWNSEFKNSKWTMTNFNYEYANENKCFENFKEMQSNLNKYRRVYKSKHWNTKYQTEYISFIYTSMDELINNLSVPLRDNNPIIISLVEKYKKIFEDELYEEYQEEYNEEDEESTEEPSNKKLKTDK